MLNTRCALKLRVLAEARQISCRLTRLLLLPCLVSGLASALATVQLAEPSSQQSDALAQAASLLQKGQSGDAEKLVREYLAMHRESADAHYLLGQILFTEQKAKESLAE